MNVLSLFDGLAGGMIALERAGIEVNQYFASEIDKYAMKIAKKNYPNIIHIGDVTKVSYKNGILYTENGNFEVDIDLLIGGSPCTSFSVAGKGEGFNGPSGLFWHYHRILNEIKTYNENLKFLLENVRMKKEWQSVIDDAMKVNPIMIDSVLVSGQSRKRLYWTNISKYIEQPKDKNIYLKDIIENGNVDRDKSYCIDACYYKGGSLENYLEKSRRQIVNLSSKPMHQSEKRLMLKEILDFGNFKSDKTKDRILKNIKGLEEKSNCLTSSSTANPAGNGATNIVSCSLENNFSWRKLTPLECERLQTLPDNYTEGVSNTQRYKMIGNGWTIDVITHIFSYLKN